MSLSGAWALRPNRATQDRGRRCEAVSRVEGGTEYLDLWKQDPWLEPVCGGHGTRTHKPFRTTVFKTVRLPISVALRDSA